MTHLGEKIRYNGDNPSKILDETLDKVRDNYDFIVIDTRPSLSEQPMLYVPESMLLCYLNVLTGAILQSQTSRIP